MFTDDEDTSYSFIISKVIIPLDAVLPQLEGSDWEFYQELIDDDI